MYEDALLKKVFDPMGNVAADARILLARNRPSLLCTLT